jgi:hypothetical protein
MKTEEDVFNHIKINGKVLTLPEGITDAELLKEVVGTLQYWRGVQRKRKPLEWVFKYDPSEIVEKHKAYLKAYQLFGDEKDNLKQKEKLYFKALDLREEIRDILWK